MIDNIKLQNIASYPVSTSVSIAINKKRVNLFYGQNGSGKSTIAKYFQDIENIEYADCSITPTVTQDDVIVYNQNFVEKNFYEKASQQGIFTIGEADASAEKEIEDTLSELNKLEAEIDDIATQEKTQKSNQVKSQNTFKYVIWNKKKTFENHPLLFCIKSERNICTKDGFLNKLLSIKEIGTTTFDKLTEEAKTLTGDDVKELPNISVVSFSSQNIEKNHIYSEKIIGETDSYLSQLIDKLGNSDWVRNGINFLDESNCPFCQQSINDDLKSNIKSLFTTVYEDKISNLERLSSAYKQSVNTIKNTFNNPTFSMEHIVKHEELETLKLIYTNKLNENITLLENKLSNPSVEITLFDTTEQLNNVNDCIKEIQQEIIEFNARLTQKDQLLSKIKIEFWKNLKQDCQSAIDLNLASQKDFDNNLKKLREKLTDTKTEKEKLEKTLTELRSRTTEIETSVKNVNARLNSLGVTGFYLKASDENSALYCSGQ